MIIKHAVHSLEMNKILKSIPYKIYCAGILLIVIMILFFVMINKFVCYEKNIKFYIQNVMHDTTCQAMIIADSTYVNYFHEGEEYLIKLENIANETFIDMKAKVLQNDLSGKIRLELSENCDTSLLFLYGTCKPYVELSIGNEKLIDVIKMSFTL